jgi:DNA mismatch repair ATPase MutS
MSIEQIQSQYQQNIAALQKQLKVLQKQHLWLAIARLLCIIGAIYSVYIWLNLTPNMWIVSVLALLLFLILKNLQQKVGFKKALVQQKITINTNEINALVQHINPMDDGAEFLDKKHPYALDLDIFGTHSLFHFINRCGTFLGKQKLAERLSSALPQNQIVKHQEAIQELAPLVAYRQDILALSKSIYNEKNAYEFLKNWAETKVQKVQKWQLFLPYFLSTSFIVLVVSSFFSDNIWWGRAAFLIFMLNLFYFVFWIKNIVNEIGKSDKVAEILQSYAAIIQCITVQKFNSSYLQNIQQELNQQNGAAQKISALAKMFDGLESVQNVVAAILFNGSVLHHIRKYNQLIQWKNQNLNSLMDGLHWICEIEKLNSFANLLYNHPYYTFPQINWQNILQWDGLGHPLMGTKGVVNSLTFDPFSLVILTGSNMSGKSTFLRALGVNSVLAYAGAPVFAQNANVCVLPILASMRLTDSINENTSYFFAEIKKLKSIVDVAQNQSALILLDEILRGTNSADKQQGTIEFIEKIKAFKGKVIIATHDLEVCDLAKKYPEDIQNYCFESQVIDNELFFDYQLRPGICANKNATFLMQKNGII